MSRAYTTEEVREMFLKHLKQIRNYWEKLPNMTSLEKLDGMVFSILNVFDGTSMGLPAFNISPSPHPDDKEYCIKNDENYFDPDIVINDCMLHDMWYNV